MILPIFLLLMSAIVPACSGQNTGPAASRIPARSNAGVVYDAARQRVLVFGGEGGRRDLWDWDGTRWSFLSDAGPSARDDAVMGFDEARGTVVLFGGRAGAGPGAIALADTWEWDGASWSRRSETGPVARMHAAGAFDPVRGVMVLFGGVGPGDVMLRDTWEWNGSAWARRDSTGPAASAPNGMAWDPVRQRLQMLTSKLTSPAGGGGRVTSELWEWDGAHWLPRPGSPPPLSPAQRIASAGAGGGLILFDGYPPSGTSGATWRWDNSAWTQVSAAGPSPRNSAALAYDAARNRVVLFGGGTNTTDFADTWEWNGSSWSAMGTP